MAYGLKACSCHPLIPFLEMYKKMYFLEDNYKRSKKKKKKVGPLWNHKSMPLNLISRGGAIGGHGGKSPPKKFQKKGKIKKYGEFSCTKLLKLAFLSSLMRKYML